MGNIYVDLHSIKYESDHVPYITQEQRDSIVKYILGRSSTDIVFLGSSRSDYENDQEGLVENLLKLKCKPYEQKNI
jgi:hypothetical protein